ncbi:MAG: ABC transporter permease subunit, partial [Aeromicrobium sp.]
MSTQTSTDPATAKPVGSRKLAVDFRQYGILAALVAIIVLFQVLTGGRLLMPGNVNNLIQQNSYVLILAIGMVMVIIAGHIDLSVGSVVAMVGAVAALAINDWHLPWWLAVLVALLAGAL